MTSLRAFLWVLAAGALAFPAPAAAVSSYLSNGQVEVGVDLDAGGTINHLARPGGPSLINDYDLGRQVQQSYYAGPNTICGAPWNPTGTGDSYGTPSQVVAHTNDGATIYVRSIPKLWSCNNVPCECTFEQWISLDGKNVRVRNRLTNNRSDHTLYSARSQELPAAYTVGTLSRLLTYSGDAPYTNGPLSEIHANLPSAAQWTATEGWAAHVNSASFGVGVFSPGTTTFIGGFWAMRGVGGPHDDPTGYISPIRRELLDWNVVYDYDYALVLGTIDEIRGFAVANRPDRRPDFRFARDRQGWWYILARDQGFPIDGFLRVAVDVLDPQMWRLDQWFSAADVPRLFIRMRHHSQQTHAQLFWSGPGTDFSEDQSVRFAVKPDDKWHTYVLNLAGHAGWTGTIDALRLDPVGVGGEAGAYVDVASISWKQAQRTVRVTTSGSGTVRSEPAGIACPPACTGTFGEGSDVTLLPEAAPGWAFDSWRGACADLLDCRLTVDEDASVEAVFVNARHARRISLVLQRHLFASGRVTVADGYADCAAAMDVDVQRRVGRRWRTVRTATTGESGRYRVRLRDRAGRYRAVARRGDAGDHTCFAATSAARKHKHRRR